MSCTDVKCFDAIDAGGVCIEQYCPEQDQVVENENTLQCNASKH